MSIFNDVLVKKPGRSLFNLSHEKKFSCDWAWLYPVLCMEALPGDTFKISTEFLVRTAPLIAPVMHRVNVKMNYFFVPNRLVWSEWKDFITGIDQRQTYNPQDTSSYFVTKVPPYFEITSSNDSTMSDIGKKLFEDGNLADFLGFPTHRPSETIDGTVKVQALPFRAYQKIYNDWFRNENVEAEGWPSTAVGMSSGKQTSNVQSTLRMRRRMWEKDYFTSALPFSQRGDEVKIPVAALQYNKDGVTKLRDSDGSYFLGGNKPVTSDVVTGDNAPVLKTADASNNVVKPLNVDNTENLSVVMGTINDLRKATKLQHWLEINARVGGRYIEQILGHFGVHSSDARLQRSEYLGGYSVPIVVSDVEQTSATAGSSQSGTTTPQANLAGKGSSYGNSKPIKCYCEEHGFIFGIMSILPRTTYQDGLPRMYQRNYKEDYYWPEYANLGEQEVNKAEVFFKLTDANERTFDRFGFQERYVEYKYVPSTVHGEFKGNLQFWHLGRAFTAQPSLSKDFCEAQPRNGIFAVNTGVSHFYVNLINKVTAMREMPRQAIPSL